MEETHHTFINKRAHWSVASWATFLKEKDLPILEPTRQALLESIEGAEFASTLSPKEMATLIEEDPYFSLRLLRMAEQRRHSAKLSQDTTTILAAVMHEGVSEIIRQASIAPLVSATDCGGLCACVSRAVTSVRLVKVYGSMHADINPNELALAVLLADLGELVLWVYAPEYPKAAKDVLDSKLFTRNKEAQKAVIGFRFKDLSLELATVWNLPPLLKQLIAGRTSHRSEISRISVELSRHLSAESGYLAVPDDLLGLKEHIPVAVETLIAPLASYLSEEKLTFVSNKLLGGSKS